MMRRLRPLLLAAVLACPPVLAAEAPDDAVAVSVAREADHILLAAEFRVPVDVRTAWSVLTDFTHSRSSCRGSRRVWSSPRTDSA